MGHWETIGGTFIADKRRRGKAYVLVWMDGNLTASWSVSDVQVIDTGAALVNVIRTEASDVRLRDNATGKDYVRCKDC